MKFGICAICEEEHELELLESGAEEVNWADYRCPKTGETFTHLFHPKDAPDTAPPIEGIIK
jgi:hypothetical protein